MDLKKGEVIQIKSFYQLPKIHKEKYKKAEEIGDDYYKFLIGKQLMVLSNQNGFFVEVYDEETNTKKTTNIPPELIKGSIRYGMDIFV